MTDKSYAAAAWLSIALAVFLPLLFAFGLAETFVGKHMLGVGDSGHGVKNLITVVIAAVIIFILVILRRLLHRRYSYSRADRALTAAVVWYMLFTVGSFMMSVFADNTWPAPSETTLYAMIVFWVLAVTSVGIIEIFLGLRLLQITEEKNELMKVFAIVTLVMGVLEVTVVLSPVALILMPVWCVTAAMVFLREKDEEKIL